MSNLIRLTRKHIKPAVKTLTMVLILMMKKTSTLSTLWI